MSRSPQITRRSILKGAAATGLAGLALPGLAACGAGMAQAGKRTLRIAAAGDSTDRLNPLNALGDADTVAIYNLYDPLAYWAGDTLRMAAARSVTPNADATEWTARLRPGMRFHNGTPVTADDLIFSLHAIADPGLNKLGAHLYGDIALDQLRKLDELTVVIGLNRPRGDLLETVLATDVLLYPHGTTTWSRVPGSGPFELKSYREGGTSTLVANTGYWDGAPWLSTVEISPIADPTARMNALRSRETDVILDVPAALLRATQGNTAVQAYGGSQLYSKIMAAIMNCAKRPFDNPSVRTAVKLAVDRKALVDTVLLGRGQIGNDMPGLGFPGYPTDVPARQRDLARARQLFASAGVTRLTLTAAEVFPGTLNAAQLIAQQLGEAGVQVKVDTKPADGFYDNQAAVLGYEFQMAALFNNGPPSILLPTVTGSQSPANLSHYSDPAYDKALAKAIATVGDTARRAAYEQLERGFRDNDGWLIWGFADRFNAGAPGIRNLTANQHPYLRSTALP